MFLQSLKQQLDFRLELWIFVLDLVQYLLVCSQSAPTRFSVFIFHFSYPANASLNCSAAESIVHREPGGTHSLHCNMHITAVLKSDDNVFQSADHATADVGMMFFNHSEGVPSQLSSLHLRQL